MSKSSDPPEFRNLSSSIIAIDRPRGGGGMFPRPNKYATTYDFFCSQENSKKNLVAPEGMLTSNGSCLSVPATALEVFLSSFRMWPISQFVFSRQELIGRPPAFCF